MAGSAERQLTMHPKAIEALSARLRTVAAAMLHPAPLPETGQSVFSGEPGTGAFLLPAPATASLKTLIAELLGKYKWDSMVSVSFVDKRFRSILQDAAKSQDLERIGPAFQQLVTEVESQGRIGHLVVVPLAGVKIAGGSLLLGNVTLRTYSPDVYAEFEERCRQIILANTAHTLQERQAAFTNVYQPQCQSLKDRVCAEMTVHAEPARAIELATEETRAAIDLLRYAALFLEGAVTGGTQKPLGLFREIGEGYRPSMVVSENDRLVTANLSLVGMPFEINDDTVALMKEVGVFELSGILTSEGRTSFEETLLDALHWVASAQAQVQKENALLNLVACLEALFRVDASASISSTIAEGVALLTAEQLDDRRKVKTMVKALYGKRSKLTHGELRNISDDDLSDLIKLARDLTRFLIENRACFASQESFSKWLEDQKLAGKVVLPTVSIA